MSDENAAAVIRAYYDAWTTGDFDRAAALLAPGLRVEVPVNEYPTSPGSGRSTTPPRCAPPVSPVP